MMELENPDMATLLKNIRGTNADVKANVSDIRKSMDEIIDEVLCL